MKKLEERIFQDGQVLGENILKVDSFLTHQVDFSLMKEIGQVFAEAVKDTGITKVVTIEASGIAPGCLRSRGSGATNDIRQESQKHHHDRGDFDS